MSAYKVVIPMGKIDTKEQEGYIPSLVVKSGKVFFSEQVVKDVIKKSIFTNTHTLCQEIKEEVECTIEGNFTKDLVEAIENELTIDRTSKKLFSKKFTAIDGSSLRVIGETKDDEYNILCLKTQKGKSPRTVRLNHNGEAREGFGSSILGAKKGILL